MFMWHSVSGSSSGGELVEYMTKLQADQQVANQQWLVQRRSTVGSSSPPIRPSIVIIRRAAANNNNIYSNFKLRYYHYGEKN